MRASEMGSSLRGLTRVLTDMRYAYGGTEATRLLYLGSIPCVPNRLLLSLAVRVCVIPASRVADPGQRPTPVDQCPGYPSGI